MQLLSVCFRPMMMAICTNRSIMQPLRWHCGGKGKLDGGGGRAGAGGRSGGGGGRADIQDRLTSSSFHKPARRTEFPG